MKAVNSSWCVRTVTTNSLPDFRKERIFLSGNIAGELWVFELQNRAGVAARA